MVRQVAHTLSLGNGHTLYFVTGPNHCCPSSWNNDHFVLFKKWLFDLAGRLHTLVYNVHSSTGLYFDTEPQILYPNLVLWAGPFNEFSLARVDSLDCMRKRRAQKLLTTLLELCLKSGRSIQRGLTRLTAVVNLSDVQTHDFSILLCQIKWPKFSKLSSMHNTVSNCILENAKGQLTLTLSKTRSLTLHTGPTATS